MRHSFNVRMLGRILAAALASVGLSALAVGQAFAGFGHP